MSAVSSAGSDTLRPMARQLTGIAARNAENEKTESAAAEVVAEAATEVVADAAVATEDAPAAEAPAAEAPTEEVTATVDNEEEPKA